MLRTTFKVAPRSPLRSVGIPTGFITLGPEDLAQDEPEERYLELSHIALVVTKTDIISVVHPPELFPQQRLPVTWQHLRHVDAYLRLLGGGVEHYNASATGYSMFQDGQFRPGKETSLTPINVIEPFFKMLGLKQE